MRKPILTLAALHVADLAILGSPDDQALGEESDAYNALGGGDMHKSVKNPKRNDAHNPNAPPFDAPITPKQGYRASAADFARGVHLR